MSIRDIVIYPDAKLLQPSAAVAKISDDVKKLVQDMNETMYAAGGIGLAAVQVGELQRIFIIDPVVAGRTEKDDPMVFINPEITSFGPELAEAEEGCLSLPEVYVPVRRPTTCVTRAIDLSGKPFEIEGRELFARAMQHEYDHLNGRLIVEHVGPLKRKMIAKQLQKK